MFDAILRLSTLAIDFFIEPAPIATSTAGQPFTGIATILGEVPGNAPSAMLILDPYNGTKGFLRLRVSR